MIEIKAANQKKAYRKAILLIGNGCVTMKGKRIFISKTSLGQRLYNAKKNQQKRNSPKYRWERKYKGI